MKKNSEILRAGISITYRYGEDSKSVYSLKKDICLISPIQYLDSLDDGSYVAISRKTGRLGAGSDASEAYASLLFCMVDTMRFFAAETCDVSRIQSEPMKWKKHRIWRGPNGKGGTRAYSRMSERMHKKLRESYEERALEHAKEMIEGQLGIRVRAFEPDKLEDTLAPEAIFAISTND